MPIYKVQIILVNEMKMYLGWWLLLPYLVPPEPGGISSHGGQRHSAPGQRGACRARGHGASGKFGYNVQVMGKSSHNFSGGLKQRCPAFLSESSAGNVSLLIGVLAFFSSWKFIEVKSVLTTNHFKLYSSGAFSAFTVLCSHHLSGSTVSMLPQTGALPLSNNSHRCCLSQPLTTTSLLLFLQFAYSGYLIEKQPYKWWFSMSGFLTVMLLRVCPHVACIDTPFPLVTDGCSSACVLHRVAIHPSPGGHLSCFYLLAIMSDAAVLGWNLTLPWRMNELEYINHNSASDLHSKNNML